MRFRSAVPLAAVVAMLGPAVAAAQVTFSNLVAPTGTLYAGSTENGFTVTPTAGTWFVTQGIGHPGANAYVGPIGSPTPGVLRVTRADGGPFRIGSVDLASNSAASYFAITASLGGVSQLSFGGSIAGTSTFRTFTNPSPATLIDVLDIVISPDAGTSSYNVDNIMVSAAATTAPEPGTVVLMASGLLALAGLATRRRRV
jgi:hypothetical protein